MSLILPEEVSGATSIERPEEADAYRLALSALNTLRFAAREIADTDRSHRLVEQLARIERGLDADIRRDGEPSLAALKCLFVLVRDQVGPLARDEYFADQYRALLRPLSELITTRIEASNLVSGDNQTIGISTG